MTLDELRLEIDRINDEIIGLISERIEVAKQIGKEKEQQGLPIRDEKRELVVIEKIKKKAAKHSLDENFIEKLFLDIIEYTVKVEKGESIGNE